MAFPSGTVRVNSQSQGICRLSAMPCIVGRHTRAEAVGHEFYGRAYVASISVQIERRDHTRGGWMLGRRLSISACLEPRTVFEVMDVDM